MAYTTIDTTNALTVKAWSEKLYRDAVKESYWSKFMGDGDNNAMQTKSELDKKIGDKITFGLRAKLQGAGVTSGQRLKGNEEALNFYDSYVTIEQYRHAVKNQGEIDERRTRFNLKSEAKAALTDWGSEKIDSLCFKAALASPTKILYRAAADGAFSGTSSAATAKAAMHATNGVISTGFISALRTWAVSSNNNTRIPIRPIKVDGSNYHVLLVSPNVMHALKNDSTFQTAQREAQDRGKDNPLFKNATAIWGNVVVHEHENIPEYTDGGGASVRYATGLLFGAQALIYARGEPEKIVAESDDYENEYAIKWGVVMGVKKPTFNSADYGSVGVYIACADITGK